MKYGQFFDICTLVFSVYGPRASPQWMCVWIVGGPFLYVRFPPHIQHPFGQPPHRQVQVSRDPPLCYHKQ